MEAWLMSSEDVRSTFERAGINLDGAAGATHKDAPESGSRERSKPFPEKCIRGTCERWIGTLEPRGEWPRAYLFEEGRMIQSKATTPWYRSRNTRFPPSPDPLTG